MEYILLENNNIQSLTEYKHNKNELINKLKLKTESEDNKELIAYLSHVKDLENQRVNYIKKIEKNLNIQKYNKELIDKISSIFSQRLRLEIDNINDKSTEVSINILNSTIGSINEHFKDIVRGSEINYKPMNIKENSFSFSTKNLNITIPHREAENQYEYKYQ